MLYFHILSLILNFSYFDEFVCRQNHQHDVSRIRWGMELKISSFQILNSLSCLNTNILYITFNVSYLHHITLHSWNCKGISAWKDTERFCISPSLHKILFGNFNGFFQQTKIFIYEVTQFTWLATLWQLCFLCGTMVKSGAQWKQRKKDWPWNVLS